MLAALFPRAYARYSSLPILGSSLDGLCFWLHARGYPRDAIQRRMRAAASLDRALRRRGVRSLSALTATMLRSYAPPPRWSGSPPRGALVRSIALYLEERGELAPTLPTPTEHQIADYRHYLEHIRGLCDSTIAMKSATAREFLLFVDHDIRPEELHDLRIADIEAFVAKIGQRVGRHRLGNVIAALRMFLRFLALRVK